MTRQELYDLMWSKPATHIAKEFGMSDVAIKKHCKKHDIPTPPVGYWAKIAHGKKVRKPKLPTRSASAHAIVDLTPKFIPAKSKASEEAEKLAKKQRDKLRSQLTVTDTLPDKPQKIIKSLRAALRKTKKDQDGFVDLGDAYRNKTLLSAGSTDRALRILQTLAKKAKTLGHVLYMDGLDCYWTVGEELFQFKIYEIKEKQPHVPTQKELKEQARYEKWYSGDHKVYRTWDYLPTGPLGFHIKDTESYWRVTTETVERRWRDRKNVSLEDQLVDIFVWLASAEVRAKEKRLQIEEYKRLEAEAKERQRRARQREVNAKELRKHFDELADAHQKMERLSAMANYISDSADVENWATQRIVKEILGYREYLSQNFQMQHCEYVCRTLSLNEEEELLIEALSSEERDP